MNIEILFGSIAHAASSSAQVTASAAGAVSTPSAFDLILKSGFVVQLVLLSLLAASVLSWSIILMKHRALKAAKKESQAFLNAFWYGQNLEEIFEKAEKQFAHAPVAAVFKAGYKELKKISQIDARNVRTESIANIHRALGRTALAETHGLEKMVGFLATIGSAAPFVGLFGTVWGIMNSFQGIGATGNANLAVVAPGISEALIATAAGLAAAIPSVMAYNYFVGRIKSIATEMDTFSQDFLNIVQRSMLKSNSAPTVNAQQ